MSFKSNLVIRDGFCVDPSSEDDSGGTPVFVIGSRYQPTSNLPFLIPQRVNDDRTVPHSLVNQKGLVSTGSPRFVVETPLPTLLQFVENSAARMKTFSAQEGESARSAARGEEAG